MKTDASDNTVRMGLNSCRRIMSYSMTTCIMVAILIFLTDYVLDKIENGYIDMTLMDTNINNKNMNNVWKINNACLCNRSDIKIFNLGFGKSGTESIHNLFLNMGCNSVHWAMYNKKQVNTENIEAAINSQQILDEHDKDHKFYVAKLIFDAINNNKSLLHYFANDVNAYIQMGHCKDDFCFMPHLTYFKDLNEQYPNSLFILLRRNITKHILSIDNWGGLRERFINADLPYLPPGKGKTDKELEIFIKNHYENVTKYFNKVAPNKLLTYDIENDKLDKLLDFIHCSGNYTLPHDHNTKEMLASNTNKGTSRL